MFKRFYQRLNIALPKFLTALFVGLLLPPITGIVQTSFLPAATALTAPTTGGAYFNASKMSYLTVSASSNFQFSTTDNFTIAWWQYSKDDTSWPRTWSIGNGSNNLTISQESGTFYLWRSGGYTGTSFSQTTTTNTWVHYAIVRSGGTLKIYENGKQKISVANSQAFGDNTNSIYIGTNLGYPSDQTRQSFSGYLTGFEIIKGTAKYSGSSTTAENFTVPSTYAEYTNSVTSGTKLLLFPTSASNLTTDLSGSGAGYTITNMSGANYNEVTYKDPSIVERTITFNANSGTGSASSTSITGNPITLATAGTLERSGYTFGGWNTAANGSGTTYPAGSSFTPTADVTLYAQWNTYIQYAANGATSGAVPDSTTAKSSAAVTTLATNSGNLTRDGFTFGGWNTNETGTGTSYTLPKTNYASTANVTLYARWDSTITYFGNGNSSGTAPTATSLTGLSGTLAAKPGTLAKTVSSRTFTFGGWNTNETGTGTNYAASSSYISTGTRNLYAQWNSAITYNGNSNVGGSIPSQTTITGISGNLATNSGLLTNGVKVFAGWNTNSSGTGTRYAAGGVYPNTGNIMLYAQWVTAISFTGSSTVTASQGTTFRSDTYTAVSGLDTKTVTYSLSPTNAGITLETSTSGSTTYAYIKIANTVPNGTYTDTLTATDAMGSTASIVVTIQVISPLRWSNSNASTVNTTLGNSKTLRLDFVNGGTGKTFALTQSALLTSPGITIDSSTVGSSFISLNVARTVGPGTYSVTVTGRDSTGAQTSSVITITVSQPMAISKNNSLLSIGLGSQKFNGTGQHLTLAAGTKWALGGTWTLEWWQYETGTATEKSVIKMSGSAFGVGMTSTTLYLYKGSNSVTLTSSLVEADRKNKWTHFAIVSDSGTVYAYQNGIRLNATGINFGSVTSTYAPSTYAVCVGTKCGVNDGTSASSVNYFGGYIANLVINKRIDYTGTSTSAANFTPGYNINIDSQTVLALVMLPGDSVLTDLSNYAATVTQRGNTAVAAVDFPNLSSPDLVALETTEGKARSSYPISVEGGNGNKTMTSSTDTPGLSVVNSSPNLLSQSLTSSATSIDSVTVRSIYETITATDASGAVLTAKSRVIVNPKVALNATSWNLSVPAGVLAYDTITALYGTGSKSLSLQASPATSAIDIFSNVQGANAKLVIRVAKSATVGTYYETITATDFVGDTETAVVVITVTPGLTLASATGSTSFSVTGGKSATLRIDASNGSGNKTFALTETGRSSSGAIRLNNTNANTGNGYTLLTIAETATAGYTYSEKITVTDANGSTAEITISVTVNSPQTISYKGATSGAISVATTAGKAFTTDAFTSALGTGSRTLSITGLNNGVSIDTSTANVGYLTLGSSMTAGTYTETITATDEVGATTRRAVTITVNPAINLSATSLSLTTTTGVAITDTVTATNGTGNKTFTLAVSPVVSGITFTNAVTDRAVITVGNTVSPGNYTITVTATDSVSATSSVNIALTVNSGISVTGPTVLSMTTGYATSSDNFIVSNGTGAVTFSLTEAPASNKVSIETISSTTFRLKILQDIPATDSVTAKTYFETITVTDSMGAKGYAYLTLKVNAPVSLNGNKTLTKVYGEELTQIYQTNAGTSPFNIFASNICTSEKSTYVADGSNGIAGRTYTVEKFNGIGTCNWAAPTNVDSATVLVVGGGGGGGSRHAGGGGGGGVLYATNYSLTPGSSYALSVGDGGAGAPSGGTPSAGQDSNFGGTSGTTSIVAKGGGPSNTTGGSGGGSNYELTGAGPANPGSTAGTSRTAGTSTMTINGKTATVEAYGQAGARGLGNSCKTIGNSNGWCGGGGGGASSTSSELATSPSLNSGTQYKAGKGGDGVAINITGAAVRYAGGGGGGAGSDKSDYTADSGCIADAPLAGQAGLGGGGAGSQCRNPASNGTANLGGGGGGGGYSYLTIGGEQNAKGGKGGSGTVIVRYLTPTPDTATTFLTMTTLAETPTGTLQLNAPKNLPVLANNASYTQTVKVTDRDGSTGATPVTITLLVTKATPNISLSIPGGGTTATYGSPVSLTANSSIAGTFNFKKGISSISGCELKSTTNGQATCSWTPTDTSTVVFSTVFTPNDSTNYNSVTSSNLTLSVLQAETLTVTFNAQTLTYTGSAASINRSYTLSGLSSIDSITAVTTLITGTSNRVSSSAYSSNTSPTDSGNYSLTGTAVTFSGSTKASYYKGISYVPGAITINRAGNAISLNYGTNNSITYKPSGTETATATFLGDGSKNFETADSSICTVDSTSGALTSVQAGYCDVRLGISQGTNYLGDTITATVQIKRAARTISIASAAPSLKYGETTTVTTVISYEALDGLISYSNGLSTGCTYDSDANILTAISGTATCSITAFIGVGTNYDSATSTSISITLSKANAPVVTLTAPANVDFLPTATSSDMALPTFMVTGLLLTDTATALSDMTVTYVASGTYAYNSTTVPTGANVYTITPSTLVLSTGDISNYQTPTYVGANWTINRIAQAALQATSLLQEGITVPYDIQYAGGSTNGTVSLSIATGGTATGCSTSGLNLRASSTGKCVIQLTMAGNQNYLDVTSETITVVIANFIQYIFNFDSLASGSSGITITSEVPITVDVLQCSSDCIPEITSLSITTFQAGDQIVITGVDFANATEVIFNRNAYVLKDNGMNVDSNTQITVVVPSGLVLSSNGSIAVKSGNKLSTRLGGLTITG